MASFLLFVSVFLVHVLSKVSTSGDSRWTIHTALSLIHDGNIDLTEYSADLEAQRFYLIECFSPTGIRIYSPRKLSECAPGRIYHFYPIGVPLLAVPAVFFLQNFVRFLPPVRTTSPMMQSLMAGDLAAAHTIVEILIASAMIALTSVVLYRAFSRVVGDGRAMLAAVLFAFCSPAWSTASRSLWQHGPSMLALSIVLWLLVASGEKAPRFQWIGLVLAMSFAIRPTNAIPLAIFGGYAWSTDRLGFRRYLMFAAPPLVLFCMYSIATYGSLVPPYYFLSRGAANSLALHARLPEALAANLISPARGLLIYMPFLLMAAYRWKAGAVTALEQRLRPWLLGTVCAHLVVVSSFEDWWGGFSYGPRYLCDMIPLLLFLFLPVLRSVPNSRAATLLLVALAVVAAIMHGRAALSSGPYRWNEAPVSVNEAPSRVWDWSDPPFLRGLSNRDSAH